MYRWVLVKVNRDTQRPPPGRADATGHRNRFPRPGFPDFRREREVYSYPDTTTKDPKRSPCRTSAQHPAPLGAPTGAP